VLDPIPSLPRSNQALEWNQLFESRDQHLVGPALARSDRPRWCGSAKRGEREREAARWWRKGWPAVSGWRRLGGRRLHLEVSAKERKREGEQEREREMCWND